MQRQGNGCCATVLDLVCSFHPSLIVSIETGYEFSDHRAVLFDINVKYQHSQVNQWKIYRCIVTHKPTLPVLNCDIGVYFCNLLQ